MLCFAFLWAGALVKASIASTRLVPFVPATYSEIQISDGCGGDAFSRSSALLIDPLRDADLAELAFSVYDNIRLVQEATQDADIESFEPAIEVSEMNNSLRDALMVGQIKNRVLWYTAAVQTLRIRIAKDGAAGYNTTGDQDMLEYTREELNGYITQDLANAGLPSRSVQWPP